MIRSFRNAVLFFVVFMAIASLLPTNSYANKGATIEGANCNPGADPALDYKKTDASQKSCVGQGITANDFKVSVRFKADADFIAAYNGVCTAYTWLFGGPFTPWGASFMTSCALASESGNKTKDIRAGSIVGFGTGVLGGDLVDFEARISGDKVCVYASTPFPLLLNFQADRTATFNAAYGVTDGSDLARLPSNCVYLPQFLAPVKPAVPSFISQTCVDYDTTASQFKWPDGRTRSFTGVVVQCVEDTMMNLFFEKHGSDTQTIFEKTQEKLKGLIQALLILYIIFLGFKYVIDPSGGLKQGDFIWVGLKIGLVMYLAAGSGLTNMLPGIIGSVKELSSIVLDAATGTPDEKAVTVAQLETAEAEYTNRKTEYATARINWSRYDSNVTGYTETEKETRRIIMDSARIAADEANAVYEKARMDSLSFGYNYCNFQPFADAGKYNYPYTAEDGSTQIRDMSYMKLWDSIDCRLAKYLGIGSNAESPSTPQALLLAIGSLLDGSVGIIIFILLITFLVFVILIVIRIVHIYIMAFIAIILLVYISPLVIPMILFAYTKSSFDAWLKQLIGYCVQPIILFAFLALMFAIFDNIIYGGNYEFYPTDKTQLVSNPDLNDNGIQRVQDKNGNLVCSDPDTLGCMYEKFAVSVYEVKIFGAKIISLYNLSSTNTSASDGVSTNEGALSGHQFVTLMLEMMKIVFACYIMHALLGMVEGLSIKLTNVAGGGATGLSGVPTADPTKIAGATAIPALKTLGRGAVAGGKFALDKTAGNAAKGARRNELKSARENK